MTKEKIQPPQNAYRLLNPGPVVVISVGDKDRDNLFTVTWNTPLRRDPGMAAILSGKHHFSYPLLARSGEFGINILDASSMEAVLGCGRTSGKDIPDKFAHFNLTRQEAERIKPPLVQEAVGNLECKVCQIVDLGPSSLIVANILEAMVDPQHFDFKEGIWDFKNGLKLLHHLGEDHFCFTDSNV